ncbi:MAG: SRPBCC family protein [Actinomycetota bacterium]|nr:SRPBCC family protein [Actinomycetota bacterium]
MATITKAAELEASPEQVWAKLTDLDSYGDWLSIHTGFPDGTPRDLSEGSTFRQGIQIMGMPGEANWTVKEIEPASSLVLEGLGPMGVTLRNAYRLEPLGEGTRITCEAEIGGAAIAAMEGPLSTASEQALTQSLEKFEQQL